MEREVAMGREVAEHWRKAFLKWQDWAEQLLKELGRQPPHGLHGDDAARQTIADLARKAPLSNIDEKEYQHEKDRKIRSPR